MATAITQTQQRPFDLTGATRTRTRAHSVALWLVSAAVAAMFLMSGWAKLFGAPQMVQLFDGIGVGQWFRYATGSIEMMSGVAVLVPSIALVGALALAATMSGAIVTHLFIVGGNPVVPLVLLLATSFIAWTRWSTR